MQQKKSYSWILFFIILFFILSSMTIVANDSTERKIIKVGFPIQEGLTQIDENGNYAGYTYEYLQEIAQYANWDYEFVQVDKDLNTSLTEMMDMLEKGEIDLLGGMIYSTALGEKYDYAGRSYGNANTVLKVLYDSDITNLNSATRSELRIAVVKGADQRLKELKEFCTLYKISPIFVECEDEFAQIAALENDEADVMLDVSVVLLDGLRTVARFAPRPFYFAATKGRTDIIDEINAAIDFIEQTDPSFSTNLYNKYFGGHASVFKLTKEEAQYALNSDPIKVGVLLNKPPFQYEGSNHEARGISIDFLDYISDKSGLKFELVRVKSEEELEELINTNKVDVISFSLNEYGIAKNSNIALTRSYMRSQSFAIMKDGTEHSNLDNKRYAYYPSQLRKDKSDASIITDSLQSALDAIKKGKADYTIGNAYTLQYYANQSEYNDFVLLPVSTDEYGIGFGIVRPVNKNLLNIFNKVIINLDSSELQNMIYPNTTYNRDFSILEWVRQNPFITITVISAVLTLIILLLVRVLRIKNRMNDKISMDLEKRKQIYALSNDYFFEYSFKDDNLMVSVDQNGEFNATTYDLDKMKEDGGDTTVIDLLSKFITQIKNLSDGTVEMKVQRLEETPAWVSITGKTIYDQNNQKVYIIGKIQNIDKQKEKEKSLIRKAEHDGLTSVYNAKTFRSKMEQILKNTTRETTGAFLLIDADNFKDVNDSYGHLQGDKALIYIGELLLDEALENGVCGRLGGDEFALYRDDIKSIDELVSLCERICQKASEYKLDDIHCLSLSIGGILTKENMEYEALYELSDQVLYKAKEKGRNGYEILM